jgi:hypothetical protein
MFPYRGILWGRYGPRFRVVSTESEGSEGGRLDHAGTDAPTVSSGLEPIQKLKTRVGFAIVLGFPLASLTQEGGRILAPKSGAECFL